VPDEVLIDLQNTIEEARSFFEVGSVAVADIICREILKQEPENREAQEIVRGIAELLTVTAGPMADGHERFVVIKAWGAGFFSDVDHTLSALLLAEMSGRTPVVHWGTISLFGGSQQHDAFCDFFEPVSKVAAAELVGRKLDYFPPKWNDQNLLQDQVQRYNGEWSRLSAIHLLGRPERVIVADYHTGIAALAPWIPEGHPLHGKSVEELYRFIIGKYLRPRPDIMDEIDAFAAAKFKVRPVIAAHARGSDKLIEDPQLKAKLALYPKLVGQLAGGKWFAPVFLLTDSLPVRDELAQRLGPRLITTDSLRTATPKGLHLQGIEDKRRLGVEVLKDAWLAARCDKFVGLGSSNVSCMIYHLKEWPKDSCIIIGPLMTHLANPYLYMKYDQLERYLPKEMVDRLRTLP
jgi:protein O-GlcNAc transferase